MVLRLWVLRRPSTIGHQVGQTLATRRSHVAAADRANVDMLASDAGYGDGGGGKEIRSRRRTLRRQPAQISAPGSVSPIRLLGSPTSALLNHPRSEVAPCGRRADGEDKHWEIECHDEAAP